MSLSLGNKVDPLLFTYYLLNIFLLTDYFFKIIYNILNVILFQFKNGGEGGVPANLVSKFYISRLYSL